MRSIRYFIICLLFVAVGLAASAGPNYQLYVNGVLYKAPSILEKGLPYFPVDVLSEATGVRVVSFSESSVRLTGSPVDFVPVVREGRPYLPAEAFAMASGSGVERDQTRGLVLYTGNAPSPAGTATAPGSDGTVNNVNSSFMNGPARANVGVTADDPGPEAPVAAPTAAVQSSPNTAGIHDAVVGAMKSAQEITYAQRWLNHKMYWANQLDPANSPYLQVNAPRISPVYHPHPWTTP